MAINQESFTQVAFAENLHRHIKRFLKSIRTQQILKQKLEAATEEEKVAGDILFKNLESVSDDELLILAANYPDVKHFIDFLVEGRKETSEIEAKK
jgi:hypothetical protein